MRKFRWVLIIVAVLVFCGLGGVLMRGMMGGARVAEKGPSDIVAVEKGEIVVEVIETGKLEAVKSVEVRSRVSGRVARLLVDAGDYVRAGQLLATIDPQETELQVRQGRAQLRGAQAGARRTSVDIEQRRVTARNAVDRARSNVAQLEAELRVQPGLTRDSILSAESQLGSAQQQLQTLVTVTQPNTRQQSAAAVQDAQNNLTNARAEADRQRRLYERGFVARREVESAELQVKLAESRLQTTEDTLGRLDAQFSLDRAQAEERVRQAALALNSAKANAVQDLTKREQYQRALRDLSDAQAGLRDVEALAASRAQQLATVDQLSASVSDAERQLGETQIIAPINGVVTSRLVQVGELVASLSSFSAGTAIVRIEDRSSMLVKLEVNEIDVAKLSVGTAASVRVDAIPDQLFEGSVRKIAPSSTGALAPQAAGADAVVKYQVEVQLGEVSPKLMTGMSARCTMRVLDLEAVLRVPRDFVSRREDGTTFVLVLPGGDANGARATEQTVTLGSASGAFVEVKEGLSVGQRVQKPPFTGPPRTGFIQTKGGDE